MDVKSWTLPQSYTDALNCGVGFLRVLDCSETQPVHLMRISPPGGNDAAQILGYLMRRVDSLVHSDAGRIGVGSETTRYIIDWTEPEEFAG